MDSTPASGDPQLPREKAPSDADSIPRRRSPTQVLALVVAVISIPLAALALFNVAVGLELLTNPADYLPCPEPCGLAARSRVVLAYLQQLFITIVPLVATIPPFLASLTLLRTKRLPRSRYAVCGVGASLVAAAAFVLWFLLAPFITPGWEGGWWTYWCTGPFLLAFVPIIAFDVVFLRTASAAAKQASPNPS